jgi:hypothetical protein
MVIAGGGSGVAYSEDPAYNSLARVGNEGDILSVNGAYLSVAQVGTYQYKPSLDSAQTWVEAQAAYEAG